MSSLDQQFVIQALDRVNDMQVQLDHIRALVRARPDCLERDYASLAIGEVSHALKNASRCLQKLAEKF